MKFICLVVMLLMISCSKEYVQVFDTKSKNLAIDDGNYVFENDTLIIRYLLWGNHGVMNFSIFNKLGRPIYIDWSRSSFINNEKKLNYWDDEVESTDVSVNASFLNLYNVGSTLPMSAIRQSKSKTRKQEKITFIPPRSSYTRSGFYIIEGDYYELNKDMIKRNSLKRNDKPDKSTWIYYEDFDMNNTPILFRNYLAVSTSELATEITFIDNEIYVSKVRGMDSKHFRGIYKLIEKTHKWGYESPEISPNSFYLMMSPDNSARMHNKFRIYNKSIDKP